MSIMQKKYPVRFGVGLFIPVKSLLLLTLVATAGSCKSTEGAGQSDMNTKITIGMTAKELEALLGRKLEYTPAAVEYSEHPTKGEYETTIECMVDLHAEGLVLYFNHYNKIIKIKKK